MQVDEILHAIAADNPASQGARASVTVVLLTWVIQYNPTSVKERLKDYFRDGLGNK